METNILKANIDKIHTTKLGQERIQRNIKVDDVIPFTKGIIQDSSTRIYKKGKNWYCENTYNNQKIIITINSYSYTVITAHKL